MRVFARFDPLHVPLILLLGGCPLPDATGSGDGDPEDDDPIVDLPGCDGVLSQTAVFAGVRETFDLGGARNCVDYQEDCREEYAAMAERARDEGLIQPRDHDELRDALMSMHAAEQVRGPLDPDELARRTIDALGVCFLLDGMEERPLESRVLSDYPDGLFGDLTGLTWYTLEFTDPWVGHFGGVLLVPDAPDGSGVLAVHGHGTEARDWPDAYHALEYARAGRTVLAVEMRENGSDLREEAVALYLLEAGLSLQGAHIYEMLVGHKYLRALEWVDPERIGLMGHSAGSMKGSVTIRITDGFAAYVTDNPVSFSPPDPEAGAPAINEDMVPGLQPLTDLFNDLSTAAMPTLMQPYGYPDGPREVLDFFAATLD